MDRADLDLFMSCLSCACEADFDGHTDFARLTAEERLFWLSQCARFTAELSETGQGRGVTRGRPRDPDLRRES